MFGGLFSLIGLSWGNGSMSVDGASSEPAGPPPAGTVLSTNYLYSYPASEGGSTLYYDSQDWENQTVTVDVIADGSGGSSLDWSNERDITYKAFGVFFHYVANSHTAGNVEVPAGSSNYFHQGTYEGYNAYHDGSGSYYTEDGGAFTNFPYGYPYTTIGNTTEVPNGSGNYFENGYTTDYIANGSGNYTSLSGSGTPYANGSETGLTGLNQGTLVEVPSGGGVTYPNGEVLGYTWNGTGGYNYPVVKTAQFGNGTDTNLTVLDSPIQLEVPSSSGNNYPTGQVLGYTWNGSGGYNGLLVKGTVYSSGTLIWESISGSQGSYEVPSGSGNYFDRENTGSRYVWDGTGNYQTLTAWYKPNGTFITNDGTSDYYWDGSGGYYT